MVRPLFPSLLLRSKSLTLPPPELPVSTTQCITGAIVGVGLCNGTWRAINWRMVAWIYLGWIITVPVTGTISGCLMGFITYAPNWLTVDG